MGRRQYTATWDPARFSCDTCLNQLGRRLHDLDSDRPQRKVFVVVIGEFDSFGITDGIDFSPRFKFCFDLSMDLTRFCGHLVTLPSGSLSTSHSQQG
jgi:hypothetical protein